MPRNLKRPPRLLLLAFVACFSLFGGGRTFHRNSPPDPGTATREDRGGSLRAADDSTESAKGRDETSSAPLRQVRNDAFAVGERLMFNVNYGFVTAGEAVLAIPAEDTVAGHRCFRVEFLVSSLPSFSWIYKVEDRYLTFIDMQTIAPWRFEQHVREGHYQRDYVAQFDQVKHVAVTAKGSYEVPPYVHDILSAFYYVRTVDLSGMKVGDAMTMSNFYSEKNYELAVKFLGRQDLEVAAGTFHTVVVEPLVKEGGLFKSEGRIVVWLTDDERRMPIRVNAKVLVGSIDTELKSYTGLNGPVHARVK